MMKALKIFFTLLVGLIIAVVVVLTLKDVFTDEKGTYKEEETRREVYATERR